MNTTTTPTPRVFDVTADTFERDVVERSRHTPVLLDFWATWCGPCKSLGPILEKLAEDYRGGFVLAKVDVDREQALAGHFQIRSVPTVMLVQDGQVTGGFPGALPEGQIRQFLSQHGVEPGDEAAAGPAQAVEDPGAAVARLRATVADEPDKAEHKLELALALMETGELDEAGELLDALPTELTLEPRAARACARVRVTRALADAPSATDLEDRVARDPDDHAARHLLGLRLVDSGDAEAGLEQLLELLRRDRGYRDGLPRQALLDAFNVIEDDALVRSARRRMNSLLF